MSEYASVARGERGRNALRRRGPARRAPTTSGSNNSAVADSRNNAAGNSSDGRNVACGCVGAACAIPNMLFRVLPPRRRRAPSVRAARAPGRGSSHQPAPSSSTRQPQRALRQDPERIVCPKHSPFALGLQPRRAVCGRATAGASRRDQGSVGQSRCFGRIFSQARDICSTPRSSNRRPAICRPIGRPSDV